MATKLTKITLHNTFHNTEMNILADAAMLDPNNGGPWFELSLRAHDGDTAAAARVARISRTLCGHDGCTCKPVNYFEIV